MSIKTMTRVWEWATEKGEGLLILLALADWTNDDGYAWPSIESLARKARCSGRQAQRIIKRLEAEGTIIIERGGGRGHTHLYKIVLKDDNMSGVTSVERMTSHPLKGDNMSQRVTSEPINGDIAVSPEPLEPLIEPLIEPLTGSLAKRKRARQPAISNEDRQKLHDRYDSLLGIQDVEESIATALTHKSALNYTDLYLFCNNWLKKESRNGQSVVPRRATSPPRRERQPDTPSPFARYG